MRIRNTGEDPDIELLTIRIRNKSFWIHSTAVRAHVMIQIQDPHWIKKITKKLKESNGHLEHFKQRLQNIRIC